MKSKRQYNDPSLQVNKQYLKKARFEFIDRVIFYIIPTAQKRVAWLRKKQKLALIGEHVHFQPRKYPTDGKRVKIHDNVAIAADVEFTAHDVIHWVFDGMSGKRKFVEYRGCIEIHENVFIGAGTRILGGVSIGQNVVIAANSLVNCDIPAGEIWGEFQPTELEFLKNLEQNVLYILRNIKVGQQKCFGMNLI